jgi:hypothetical protein
MRPDSALLTGASSLLPCAILSGICVLGFTSSGLAEHPSGQREMGWVGLYNAALVDWLENENRLNERCSDAIAGSPKRRDCRDEMMKPKQYSIRLRSAPQDSATSEGALVIVATPGQGLRAYYRPVGGGPMAGFVPDLFDADWGYGPYFHQTFLERQGTWFLLPAVPLPRPAWIDASEFTNEADVRGLTIGDVIKTPRGDLVVLGLERGVLRARPEQDADMWCKEGDPPPLKPSMEIRIPVEELYAATGHLLVGIKYMRGC